MSQTLPLTLSEAQHVLKAAAFLVKLMDPNPHDNEAMGPIDRFIAHWAATSYYFLTPKYHFCIVKDPKTGQFQIIQTLSIRHKGEHLWGRNGGAIGITMAAMGEERDRLGRVTKRYPVLKEQVILEAYTAACIIGITGAKVFDAKGNRLTVKKPGKRYNKLTDGLESTGTTFDVYAISDHGEQALQDGYQAWRYDIDTWKDEFFTWTWMFREWIKAGDIPNMLDGKVK